MFCDLGVTRTGRLSHDSNATLPAYRRQRFIDVNRS